MKVAPELLVLKTNSSTSKLGRLFVKSEGKRASEARDLKSVAIENDLKAKTKMKKFDGQRDASKSVQFKVGEFVWLKNTNRRTKTDPIYEVDPYVIAGINK